LHLRNNTVCHGIPNDKALKNGDIVNIDVTLILDGWYGDSSRMYFVGDVPKKAQVLCDVTHESMMRGIHAARNGGTTNDIGAVIQKYAEGERCGVVRDYCGHGLGRVFHDAPTVLHYVEPAYSRDLAAGMFFTIEPMLNAGRADTRTLSDGWTVVTRDRSLSAQFEHSIGLTETGVEIFTLSPKGYHKPPYK
jgi:methionyl aminopeptidase